MANVIHQLLREGLVDELSVDVMPVILGDGLRFLENLDAEGISLEKLRVDQIGQRTSYGAPAFMVRGRPLVAYGAAKHHCAFYVMSPAVMEAHQADLQGYDTSKGTIRFPPDKPLSAGLVAKLVGARMAEIEAGTGR